MKRVHYRAKRAGRRWASVALTAAAGAVTLSPGGAARGGVTYSNSSDVTFRHDPDRESSAVAPRTLEISTIPTASNLLFQLNSTFTSGSANTRAVGGFGHVTNATTATFVLKPGTGVTQDDPGNAAYPGSSSLKINIDSIWNVDQNGFGPLATGYISLSVGGIVGDGGFAKFLANVQFTDLDSGVPLRSDWVVNRTFSEPGSFSRTFTTSEVLVSEFDPLGELNQPRQLRVKGYVEFRASNAETPSSIEPLEMEVGGAPPTGSWTGLGANRNWTNPDNWLTPDEPDPQLLPIVPNATGHRARFISRDGAERIVNVDAPVRIGTLDVDGFGAFVFQGEKITFDVQRGPAVWNVRNVQGAQEHRMNSVTELLRPLEITTDATTRLNLAGPVRGPGMSLTKAGDGRLRLGALNAYSGGTLVRGGVLVAAAEGSLGSGPVNVQNSLLEYNAQRAIASNQLVTIGTGGIVELGIVPTTADRFSVLNGGAISGNSAELGALTVGPGGNLQLQAGALITNTQLQPIYPASLGDQPAYLLGLTSGVVESVAIGTGTTTPWIGIGTTRGDVTFGTATNIVKLAGVADLSVPTSGTLTIGSSLQSIGTSAATLVKKGAGTAVLMSANNLAFASRVLEGTLLINGAHPGDIEIAPGGILGGTGSVGGRVSMPSGGGYLAPGASLGTLSIQKLDLNSASQLDFEIDTPTSRDFVAVGGELVLDGKLNIQPLDNFGPGRYTLFRAATISNQTLEIGDAPEQYAYNVFTMINPFRRDFLVVLDVLGLKQWNLDGGGDWGAAANWLGPLPDGVGARASFLQKVSPDTGPAKILLNGMRTVGRLEFDNDGSYEIQPGTGGSLRLDNGGDGALVEVNGGRHTIATSLTAADDADIDVNGPATLTVTGGLSIAAGKTVRKVSDGMFEARGGVGGGLTLGIGSKLLVNQGVLRTGGIRGFPSAMIRNEATLEVQGAINLAEDGHLLVRRGLVRAGTISGGSLSIRDGAVVELVRGGLARPVASKVSELTFDGETNAWRGRLDVGDNDLVVQATAARRNEVLARVANQVKTARNPGRGARWSGNGITSSNAGNNPLTTLAVILNDSGTGTPLFERFASQTVDLDSILIKYTWNGDANLDGRINSDDYFRIDRGFLSPPVNPTYAQGDFNYDGLINSDDYFLIDSAFLGQSGVLTAGGVGGAALAAAVPEPSMIVPALVTGAALLRRRRRVDQV